MQRVNESGRSMVEMLGVLAIIGLLSVGGIAGYIQAMNSHRANETIQRLMRRAVVISGQRQLGQNASLAGFNENDGTYTMTLNEGASGNATTFTMGVSGVPEEVCTRIKNMDWKIATVSDDCATFTFNNDLTERSSDSGSGEAETCNGVKCGTGCCTNGSTCDQETHTCCKEGLMGDGETVSKECCAPGMTPYQHDYMGIQCCEGKVLDNYCCGKGTTPYHDYNGIQCCPEGNRIEAPGDGYEYCLAEGEYLFSKYGSDWMACPTSNFMSYDESKGITSGCCCSSLYDGEGVPVYTYYYEDVSGCVCAPEGTKEAYTDCTTNTNGCFTVYCSKGVDKEYYRQNESWRCLE